MPVDSLQIREETEMGVKTYCRDCGPEEFAEEVEKHLAAGPSKRKQPEVPEPANEDANEEETDAPPSKIANVSGGGMTIEKYSDYSLVLRGETTEFKEALKTLGLKYNRNLKVGGPGWIFPNALRPSVEAFLANPTAPVQAPPLSTATAPATELEGPAAAPYTGGDTGLIVEQYSAHSFVVRGNTMPFKDALKSLGGSYNPRLKQGGPGWIFPSTLRPKIDSFLANPSMPLPTPSSSSSAASATSPSAASSASSSVYVEPVSDKSFIVKGDTRPVKDKLSALGGKWSGAQKGWTFANSQLEKVNEFIANLSSPSAPLPSSPPPSAPSSSSSPSALPAVPAMAPGSVVCEVYSEKAVVVRGETKPLKAALTALGCKWNGSLKGGCGWIASKSKQAQIEELIKSATAQQQ